MYYEKKKKTFVLSFDIEQRKHMRIKIKLQKCIEIDGICLRQEIYQDTFNLFLFITLLDFVDKHISA